MSPVNAQIDRPSPTLSLHPRGRRAKVLLASVCGPYAQDDEHGSRSLNPMELYHNQVTRVQGPFSLRMFHRSWGLMLIQANLTAPCTVLDFPTWERFEEELRGGDYDVVGISSIVLNQHKVRTMCEMVRRHLPNATIVIGGHIANVPDLADRVDADHIVRGDGVSWFRRFLDDQVDEPLRHPLIVSGFGARCMGMKVEGRPEDTAATLIPSVGCPLGCNFCSTSAMFGGKGKSVDFYKTGDELFDIMHQLSTSMKVRSFFIMDENFLLQRSRALRVLELMERHRKPWSLYVFSSANALRRYTLEELVRIGVSWVWMGLEGEESAYKKLSGVDTFGLVRGLQSHGIRVLGSSIIGLEDHSPENIDRVIAHSVRHRTDFHQYMLYTPIPGTPLHAELSAAGRLLTDSECDPADVHGQSVFNYRHSSLPPGVEGELMVRAFTRDFEQNGPSVVRIAETTLAGWLRHKSHPDPRVRDRMKWEARPLSSSYAAMVAAARLYFRDRPDLHARMDRLLGDLIREFGWKARASAALGGRLLHWTSRREADRLARGWSYEPDTFYEVNEAAAAQPRRRRAALCRSVGCSATSSPAAEAHS
ncbi:B12-binding domain-containing radical SAM protein [Paludisphaera mucosa]|uniref:Cobalamin-dependent protein n=1 Tax=Paludisphaera mucosa TaxID=3030827 RepID=A0ABT6F468_9BACT|nr:radical SAM protein [Paludisphaera mucosa]MDG3002291.1 cobalamin-dependent protein [Paludisphaera mucosa]